MPFTPSLPLASQTCSAGLRWLYVDCNSYFASVEQQVEPRLRDRPVAVLPVMTDFTCAIAASYEAKAFGIRTGTPVHEAKKLCPDLICVQARHDLYVEFHHRIVEEIDRHVPISAVCSIDEVACQLLDNEAPEPVAIEIARSIKRGMKDRIGPYIRCSIGLAPNRYLAKIAADLQKPDGLSQLRADNLPGPLLKLATTDLPGVGRKMEKRLLAAGITDMPTLWALNAEQMRRAWGNIWGERIWHLLRGRDLPERETERQSVGHSHVLTPELRTPDKAFPVARRLAMKAASRLRRMDYDATEMSFSVRLENGQRLQNHRRFRATQDSFTFLALLDSLWQGSVGSYRRERIKKVSVVLHGLVECAARQGDLFDELPAERGILRAKAERISHMLDHLNQRYGRDTVLVGMLPSEGRGFSGTKIAFTRIPQREEFQE